MFEDEDEEEDEEEDEIEKPGGTFRAGKELTGCHYPIAIKSPCDMAIGSVECCLRTILNEPRAVPARSA